jgi:hypothetical protein
MVFSEMGVYVLYSTLLHLPLLRFHCVGGCWDRTQNSWHWVSDALVGYISSTNIYHTVAL